MLLRTEVMQTCYIITGTNRGLGKALLENLVLKQQNERILAISRNIKSFQGEELNKQASDLVFVEADLNDPNTLLDKIAPYTDFILNSDKLVFINNAGITTPVGPVGILDEVDLIRSINVNTATPAVICNFLMKILGDREICLVNISSGSAKSPISGWSAYCSGKAYAKMFFDTLALEFAGNTKVRVLSIDPGVIDTDMQQEIRDTDPAVFSRSEEFILMKKEGKLQRPEDVAERILNQISLM